MDGTMKFLLTILVVVSILLGFLIGASWNPHLLIDSPTTPPDQTEALNRLKRDSIHTHHVIKRQNEMILDFQKYGNLYNIKEEDNCFTNNKN